MTRRVLVRGLGVDRVSAVEVGPGCGLDVAPDRELGWRKSEVRGPKSEVRKQRATAARPAILRCAATVTGCGIAGSSNERRTWILC